MHATPDDDGWTAPTGGLGWLVGLLIVVASLGVTIGTVLGTPLGGHATAPYQPFAHGIARDLPGEPDEAPPHLRDLQRMAQAIPTEASRPAPTESLPHLP